VLKLLGWLLLLLRNEFLQNWQLWLFFEAAIFTIADMKYLRPLQTFAVLLALICLTPIQVYAAAALSAPVLITEMSPGTTVSASQEFIELYNQSNQAIDLGNGGWQIQITTSKATTWEKAKTISLGGTFYPGTYLIISSSYKVNGESKSYLEDNATAQFSAGLTGSSGHIRLVRTAVAPATGLQPVDTLEWSTKDTADNPISQPISGDKGYVSLDSALSAGESLKRKVTSNIFVFTDTMGEDFITSDCPSPTATNTLEYAKPEASEPIPTSVDTANQSCNEAEQPEGSEGGGVITPGPEPPAVLLPADPEIVDADTSASTPRIPAADIGLASPSITELLPNPGSPQTDSQDEFIELYNSNDATFDLSGFQLYIGLTGSKHYTFPEGTTIAGHTFKAFFSVDTKISLSNTGGKVVLYDPLGKLLVQTGEYATAKDNQAWALASGKWQWTTKPTPNATNVVAAPASAAKKKAAAKTAAKKTVAKSTNASNTKTSATTNDAQTASNLEEKRPLHPLALAVVGGFALLYGAYEYRHDVANKFYQLRSYRAARRKTRQELKGR